MSVSPSFSVGVPLLVRVVAVLKGGGVCCCGGACAVVFPVFVLPLLSSGWVRYSSHCPVLLSYHLALLVYCVAVSVWVVGVWCGWWECGGVCGVVVCACSLSSLPLLPFVGGVRGSARAALRARTSSPNTIVSSCCLPVFFSLPPRLSISGMAVGHHVLEHCVGMTATGSLSLSSSFFW